MSAKDKKPATFPKWFKIGLDDLQKSSVKKAVCHYIADDYDGDDYPLANMTTYMGVVKKLATLETKWKKVTKDNFKPKSYTSHQHL
jgi:hypothetical protein